MAVYVLDKRKKPLMPCSEKRARQLLERGRARVHKVVPFTIRLVDRLVEDSVLQPVAIKIDPGSKTTGAAVVRETEEEGKQVVLSLMELEHRAYQISQSLTQRASFRRRRRSANLRYRAPRFNNRTKPEGWLPPSVQHRVDGVENLVKRLRKLLPVTGIAYENVKFDLQQLQNPEVSGVEYQQRELFGYEVREYLLEKWARKCAYCNVSDTPLEIEHIVPKSKGGANRISNLTLACVSCNQKKGNKPVSEFLKDKPDLLQKIFRQAKTPLRDAAAVNATRWAIHKVLKETGPPVVTASGGKTKYNRATLGIPKAHVLDAACVGEVKALENWSQTVLIIKGMGRGAYKRTRLDRYGFPRGFLMREKQVFGFQTGDLVLADIPRGKHQGSHKGRAAVRKSGSFDITTAAGKVAGIRHKHCKVIQRNDGYAYFINKLNYGAANSSHS